MQKIKQSVYQFKLFFLLFRMKLCEAYIQSNSKITRIARYISVHRSITLDLIDWNIKVYSTDWDEFSHHILKRNEKFQKICLKIYMKLIVFESAFIFLDKSIFDKKVSSALGSNVNSKKLIQGVKHWLYLRKTEETDFSKIYL